MKKNLKHIASWLRSINARILSIIAISIFTIGLVYQQDSTFDAREPLPEFDQLSPQEARFANKVHIGLHVKSFPEYSLSERRITFDGILWFKFPAGSESLATLEKFQFHNSVLLRNGKLIYTSAPIIQQHGENVVVCYNIMVEMRPELNFINFPLSAHRVNLILKNESITHNEIEFISSDQDLTVSKSLFLKNFKISETAVKTGYIAAELNSAEKIKITHPAACFSFVFDSVGVRDLLSLYFPMLVLFLISLFCLLIDIFDKSRLGYVATAVPILVLFRMVIDASLPETGYVTHVDYFFNTFVFLSISILIFQSYVIMRLQAIERDHEEKRHNAILKLEIANNIVFYSIIALLFILGMLTFLR